MPDVMNAIRASKTALVFVNTRSRPSAPSRSCGKVNDDNLPIALHHGSLAPSSAARSKPR
jgi:ATP-dependent Lhr-like helicase